MMDGDVMGLAVANAIMDSGASAEAKTQVIEFWQKICGEIVSHIQNNAVVPSGITVSTTGSAVAQTGSTTGTGKVQ